MMRKRRRRKRGEGMKGSLSPHTDGTLDNGYATEYGLGNTLAHTGNLPPLRHWTLVPSLIVHCVVGACVHG